MGEVIAFPRQRPEPVKMPLCFRIGALAYDAGIPFINNPYSPIHHATAYQEWSDGWWAASWGSKDVPA